MTNFSSWLVVSVTLLLCGGLTAILAWMLLRAMRTQAAMLTTFQAMQTRSLDTVDRLGALAAASDLHAYQGIRAMEVPALYAEAEQDAMRVRSEEMIDREDDLDDASSAALDALFGAE